MARKSKRTLTGITLTGMHESGRSFGYWGSRKVYTGEGIPGETVDVQVHIRQRDWLSAQVVKVVSASEHRVMPFCKHAAICGGCIWQHIDYSHQLQLKKQLLISALQKQNIQQGEIPNVIASPQLKYYRNKLDFSFSARRWYYQGEGRVDEPAQRQAMGFHPADNAEKVFQVEECFLLREPALSIAHFVQNYANDNSFTYFDPKDRSGFLHSLSIRLTLLDELMATVTFSQNLQQQINGLMEKLHEAFPEIGSLGYNFIDVSQKHYVETEVVNYGNSKAVINEKANGLTFQFGADAFYQPNHLQAEHIYRDIEKLANLTGNENVIDLYCGIGTIALTLARKAKRVTGIEGSAEAIKNARQNALANGINNASFICGDILETFTSEFLQNHPQPDVIVLDPPRAGTLISIKKTILASGAKKVIYLSCNPFSLAVDLKMLCEHYQITHIQAYDMFPHTAHVETLVVLEK